MILAVIVGVAAGLKLMVMAVLATVCGWLLIWALERPSFGRLQVRGLTAQGIPRAADAYRQLLLQGGCRILAEKKKFTKGMITFRVRGRPRPRLREARAARLRDAGPRAPRPGRLGRRWGVPELARALAGGRRRRGDAIARRHRDECDGLGADPRAGRDARDGGAGLDARAAVTAGIGEALSDGVGGQGAVHPDSTVAADEVAGDLEQALVGRRGVALLSHLDGVVVVDGESRAGGLADVAGVGGRRRVLLGHAGKH